ncbi:uncharacterized protein LOC111026905 isoform X2 [Myzus persicae]|uniref:uncharacterized protein LOC111026905 isoform X2 n=1 Tax=Myzus persicae TaxID=13164 RepID=UPI000B93574F|nr:uncharacterized protein LOC111026905 isoform X2 [Myzus persicae]
MRNTSGVLAGSFLISFRSDIDMTGIDSKKNNMYTIVINTGGFTAVYTDNIRYNCRKVGAVGWSFGPETCLIIP